MRPNVRGSSGYGQQFRYANYGDWGGGDFRDLMYGVDHLINLGVADADRLGIMGWSYGGFWDKPEAYRAHAAMFQVKGVTTPTLIQHGERDERVPLSQGQELYNALKRQGCETKMVVYPRTPHGIEEPRLLLDCMNRNLEWFESHIAVTGK